MSLPKIRLEDCESISQGRWRVDDAQARHLLRVRRLSSGDEIEGLNGASIVMLELEESKDGLFAVAAGEQLFTRGGIAVTLLVGLLKSEQWNAVLRTSSELGVREVVPIYCERSVPTIEGSKLDDKMIRWRRVLGEASKVSGGAVPSLREPRRLVDVDFASLPGVRYAAVISPDAIPIARVDAKSGAAVAIGPEGDWTDGERDLLLANGFVPMSLGPRVLRASTAATAVCAWFAFSTE